MVRDQVQRAERGGDARTACAFFPTPEAVSEDEMFALIQEWAAANFLMAAAMVTGHAPQPGVHVSTFWKAGECARQFLRCPKPACNRQSEWHIHGFNLDTF